PYQFVHDRRIIKCKCAGKDPVPYNSVGLSRRRDHDHCRRDQPSRPTAGMDAPSDQIAPDRLLLPSRGGTRPTRMREHENLMPHLSKNVRAAPIGRCATVQIRGTGFGGRSGRLGFPPASAMASVITMRTLTK